MGSFPGHLLPGTFFVCFAFWWTTQLFRRKKLCEIKGIPYYSTVTYQCGFQKCLEWPVEGMIKVIATTIGMAGEIFAAFDYGQSSTIVSLGDIQHVTMYAFFCLSGVCDILQARSPSVPAGLDYIAFATAFAAEGILFKFHLHGRSDLDTHLHVLLVGTIFACVAAILLEYKHPHNILASIMRTYFIFVQGTWFIQVWFILYNPIRGFGNWDPKSHESIQLATLIFLWHCFVVALLMTSIIVFTSWLRNKYCPVSPISDEYHLVGHSSYRLIAESEDEEVHDEVDEIYGSGQTEQRTNCNGGASTGIANGNTRQSLSSIEDQL